MKIVLLLVLAAVRLAAASPPELVVPRVKTTQVILRSSDFKERNYFLTPNLVRTSEREVLITIKRGTSHGWEESADAEMIRFADGGGKVTGSG